MSPPTFNHEFDARYGEMVAVAPGIRRVVANNPGPFTGPGTGTYIIGTGQVGVIDPGPMLPDHVDAILNGLGDETVSHILITHTHADHCPASRLLKQRTGAAIFALGLDSVPESVEASDTMANSVDIDFVADFSIRDEEILSGDNWAVRAIHTPGHCADHLCFALLEADGQSDALFCGDHLMAWSSTVILPPQGSVADYLASLDRLAERPESIYYPTHGAPITEPSDYIRQIRDHRLQRVAEVQTALTDGCHSTAELRKRIYPDISEPLFGGAEKSIEASLIYLNQQT